jgi:hypothetical protein
LNKPDDELPVFDPEQPKPPDRPQIRVVDRATERGERIERVGRALYGGLWIELKKEDYEIGRANRAGHHPTIAIDLPSSGKEAATIVRARFLWRASDEQTGQVIHWLNNLWINDVRILDALTSEFDAWFLKEFPDVSTQKRKDAVREAVKSGLRPPSLGGAVPWEKFCNHVREQSGQQCDNRTIMRDVEELRLSQS